MTEVELRRQVVAQAKAWYGLKENDGSFKPIIDVYNNIKPLPSGYRMRYTDPWCAAFVSAVAAKCGLTNIIFPSASCDRMIALYKAAGRWEENDAYNAQPGDIIFYDWQDDGVGDNTGSSDHVGVIAESSGNYFRVFEGNMSDAVGNRSIAKNGKYIRGFGLPDYASVAGGHSNNTDTSNEQTVEPSAKQSEMQTSTSVSSKPTIRFGAKNVYVEQLQKMLIAAGYSLPKYGADGKFGNETLLAVYEFQSEHGLDVDGIVGQKTWAALEAAVNNTSEETEKSGEVIVEDWAPAIGDVVEFFGNAHFVSAASNRSYPCTGGKAKVTAIYSYGNAPHPYHLVNMGGGCSVYGWVNPGTFRKV